MTFIKDKSAYKTARLSSRPMVKNTAISQTFSCAKLTSLNMLKDSSIETAKNTADNLYQLMELINSNITDMDIEQIISYLASGSIYRLRFLWMDSEFERREKQRN
jgi:hypothetical protein